MSFAYDVNPTRVLSVTEHAGETRLELAFDLAPDRWPWLALPPQHPVVIEKLQYLAGMTALMETGGLSEGRASALTYVTWACDPTASAGHATHATCTLLGSFSQVQAGQGRFVLALRDDAGRRVADLTGAGVVFEATDSRQRRAAAKAKAKDAAPDGPRSFVPASEVGAPDGVSFLGPLAEGRCEALVTTEGGFHPAHPFHTGSGDHVNAGHLVDVALQFAHLVRGRPLTMRSGAATFRRFVELDVPFEVQLEPRQPNDDADALTMTVHQVGRLCASIEGTFQ